MVCLFTSFLINILVGREDLLIYMNLLYLMEFATRLNSLFHMNGMPFLMITMCSTTSIKVLFSPYSYYLLKKHSFSL